MLTNRTEALNAYISSAGFSGYANERTLARAMTRFADSLRAKGYENLYEVHQIKSGPAAGRWVGLLVLGPREPMTPELCAYAAAGLAIYQHRLPESSLAVLASRSPISSL